MFVGTIEKQVCTTKFDIASLFIICVSSRQAELGCRKWMGTRELFLAPMHSDSVPIESIDYNIKVWRIVRLPIVFENTTFSLRDDPKKFHVQGVDVESIADVPLDDFFSTCILAFNSTG